MEIEVLGRLESQGTKETQLWKSLNGNIWNKSEMELFQVIFKVQNAPVMDYCLGFLWQAADMYHFNIQIFTECLQMLGPDLSVTDTWMQN